MKYVPDETDDERSDAYERESKDAAWRAKRCTTKQCVKREAALLKTLRRLNRRAA